MLLFGLGHPSTPGESSEPGSLSLRCPGGDSSRVPALRDHTRHTGWHPPTLANQGTVASSPDVIFTAIFGQR